MFYFRFLIIGFFFFFSLGLHAQLKQPAVKVFLGEELKRSPKNGLHQLISNGQEGLFTLQKKMKPFARLSSRQPYIYQLRHYDEQMNLLKEQKLSFQVSGKDAHYEFGMELGGSIFLFASRFKQETGKKQLLAWEINKHNMEEVGEEKVILEVPSRSRGGYFSYKLSNDKSKLLLLYAYPIANRKGQAYDLFVLDESLNSLWSKKENVPQAHTYYQLEQYEIDESGNVFLLNTLFQDKRREKKEGAPDYTYHLTSYTGNGEVVNRYGIGLAGNFLSDLKIALNREQEIVGGGFYAEEGSYELAGSYFFTIDKHSGEVLTKSMEPFEAGFIKEEITAGEGDVEVRKFGYRIHELLFQEDGGAVLLGEQYKLSTQNSTHQSFFGRTRINSNYVYEYNDIVLVGINAEGRHSWTQKVQKNQYSKNDQGLYSSFFATMIENTLYLVFNGALPSERRFSAGSGFVSTAQVIRVSENGEKQSSLLTKLNKPGLRLMPGTAIKTAKEELVLMGEGPKYHHFIKLRFNNHSSLSLLGE